MIDKDLQSVSDQVTAFLIMLVVKVVCLYSIHFSILHKYSFSELFNQCYYYYIFFFVCLFAHEQYYEMIYSCALYVVSLASVCTERCVFVSFHFTDCCLLMILLLICRCAMRNSFKTELHTPITRCFNTYSSVSCCFK